MSKFKYFRTFETLERDDIPIPRPPTPPAKYYKDGVVERSPAKNKYSRNTPKWVVEDREASGPKAAPKVAALLDVQRKLASFQEADFSNPTKRQAYRRLRSVEEGLKKINSPAVDRRFYNPAGHEWPYTKYGTAARLSGFATAKGAPMFKQKSQLLPCVERAARRMVMFALGKAGRGYRVKHRRNSNSGVPC